MKSLGITFVFLIALSGFSQEEKEKFLIEKGQWNLETDLNINLAERESSFGVDSENDTFSFEIQPKLGYFISDNLVLGLGLGYGYSNSEFMSANSESLITGTTNTFSITPYVKKFFPISQNLAIQLQAETRYSKSKTDNESQFNPDDSETRTILIGLRPGLAYRISDSILLQGNFGLLSYQNRKVEFDSQEGNISSEDKLSSFGLNLSSTNIFLGLSILL